MSTFVMNDNVYFTIPNLKCMQLFDYYTNFIILKRNICRCFYVLQFRLNENPQIYFLSQMYEKNISNIKYINIDNFPILI